MKRLYRSLDNDIPNKIVEIDLAIGLEYSLGSRNIAILILPIRD